MLNKFKISFDLPRHIFNDIFNYFLNSYTCNSNTCRFSSNTCSILTFSLTTGYLLHFPKTKLDSGLSNCED